VGKHDSRVDAYIAKSAPFAKPILRHIRRLVHTACPDVEETIKWGFPHFIYCGNLCYLAAFKHHCAFGFWHRAMRESHEPDEKRDGMGQLGKIIGLSDLPKDSQFVRNVKRAMRLNAAGTPSPPTTRPKAKRTLKMPDDLTAALRKNKRANATFEAFNYSNKKEYIEWIIEARREETRAKRLATAIQWLAEGKVRNWKYVKK
jgi:hypothetical protein